jgi:hypothetical protein
MVQFAYVDYNGLGRPQFWASLPHATHPLESRQSRRLHKRYDHPVERTLCRFSLIEAPNLSSGARRPPSRWRLTSCNRVQATTPNEHAQIARSRHVFFPEYYFSHFKATPLFRFGFSAVATHPVPPV